MMTLHRQVNPRIFIIIVAVCAVVVYWVIRYATQDDEGRLRKLIYSAVVMVEKEDAGACSLLISSAYEDSYGNHRKEICRLIEKTFMDFRDFKINIKNIKIEMDGFKAMADIGFIVCFKLKDDEQFYYDTGKLAVSFRKQKSLWKVFSIAYMGSNDLLFMNTVA